MHDAQATRLSALIGLIYDAAIDPARWEHALAAMLADTGLRAAALSLATLPDNASVLNVTSNMAEPFASAMPAMLPHLSELWGGHAVLSSVPLDAAAVLSRIADRPPDRDNPAWRDWMQPQGMDDVLALTIARDPTTVGAVSMGRHRDAPPIDDALVARTELYIPHLQRAAAITRLLDVAALREATFAALFDTLAAPVLLVGDAMAIVHANFAARALLARGTAIRSRGGVLSLDDRDAEVALAAAVRRIAPGRMAFGIPLARADGVPYLLHVLPLRPAAMGAGACAAVFVGGAATPPALPDNAVEALFGLTRAEGLVLARIVAGDDVPATANALGIAPSTVRTHLLHLYDKTGVRRQADLVRLAAKLGAPVRG